MNMFVDFDAIDFNEPVLADDIAQTNISKAIEAGKYVMTLTLKKPLHPSAVDAQTNKEKVEKSDYVAVVRDGKLALIPAVYTVEVKTMFRVEDDTFLPYSRTFTERYYVRGRKQEGGKTAYGEVNKVSADMFAELLHTVYALVHQRNRKDVSAEAAAGMLTQAEMEAVLSEGVVVYGDITHKVEKSKTDDREYERNGYKPNTFVLLDNDMMAQLMSE